MSIAAKRFMATRPVLTRMGSGRFWPIEDNQNSAVYEAVAEKVNEKNVRRGLRQRDVKTAAESGRIVEARRRKKNPIAPSLPQVRILAGCEILSY
ncbi:hypothetical protein GCN74_26720 [Janthinobacterium sp. FT14W]|uniref:hypothetical protein n=1 Tax=Janthinobacterium sp. FT14W TaxID=2654253 RepID=UPI001264C880|nr:hypothetical protein [Janthinobacterium sp. FT14W]KAB8051129.1 hypothetical protein GCN74_26720 [Janthinobacterium sp. FT14W]